MAGSKKFEGQANRISDYISQLFSRSMRAAILEGLEVAVKTTKQDSSNAAAHWLIGARGTKPGNRRLGKVKDMRGTLGIRGPRRSPIYPVGYQGDEGANEGSTLKFVRDREMKDVLDKMISGRSPEFRFYLYNAVGGTSNYNDNANIQDAGEAGVAAVVASAERRIDAGNKRKATL